MLAVRAIRSRGLANVCCVEDLRVPSFHFPAARGEVLSFLLVLSHTLGRVCLTSSLFVTGQVLAKSRVPKPFWEYVESGSWTQSTLARNTSDFSDILFRSPNRERCSPPLFVASLAER